MYKIEYNENEKHVYVRTNGQYSENDVNEFLHKSVEFSKRFNCYRIMIDHRNCMFSASITAIYMIAADLFKYGFNSEYKGGVVYSQDQEKYEFADTVAHNYSHGILRFFNDVENAKEWLHE